MTSIRVFDPNLQNGEFTVAKKPNETEWAAAKRMILFLARNYQTPEFQMRSKLAHALTQRTGGWSEVDAILTALGTPLITNTIRVFDMREGTEVTYTRETDESMAAFKRRVLEEAVVDTGGELKLTPCGDFPDEEYWIVGVPVEYD